MASLWDSCGWCSQCWSAGQIWEELQGPWLSMSDNIFWNSEVAIYIAYWCQASFQWGKNVFFISPNHCWFGCAASMVHHPESFLKYLGYPGTSRRWESYTDMSIGQNWAPQNIWKLLIIIDRWIIESYGGLNFDPSPYVLQSRFYISISLCNHAAKEIKLQNASNLLWRGRTSSLPRGCSIT